MKNRQNKINLTLIGGYNSGKTKLCEYLVNNKQNIDFSYYQATTGASYMSKIIVYKKFYFQIDIWDTSGQDKYDALTKFFCKDADIVFIFFIYNSKDSFVRANALFQLVKYVTKPDVIFALIGNK